MEVIVSLKSKADALVFAINKATNGSDFDKEKADDIYDYILSKVNLPDVEVDASASYLNAVNEMMASYRDALAKSLNEA